MVGYAMLVCLYVMLCEGKCKCVFEAGVWFVGGVYGERGLAMREKGVGITR
jgi:hypothetical protein